MEMYKCVNSVESESWSVLSFWVSLIAQLVHPNSIPGWRRSAGEGMGYPLQYSWASLTLCKPGILQARILEWLAFPFSRGSSQPMDWTQASCIAGGFFTSWATREAQNTRVVACPFSNDLPHPGVKLGSSALQVDSLPTELSGKPFKQCWHSTNIV